MIIDDFVMLARTEPVESKKHGWCVCSAGYSRELRNLVRIYPLSFNYKFPAWSKARINVRRPKQDNRIESWRLNNDDDPIGSIEIKGKAIKDTEFDFLKSLSAQSIKKLNQNKLSLAIVNPSSFHPYFKRRKDVDPAEQNTIFDRLDDDRKFPKSDLIPYIRFSDIDGEHNLQLKEWGASEFLRKYRTKADHLWDAYHLNDPNYEHLFLIGNQNGCRMSWLIIRIISRKKEVQNDLFA
jgi:hypothetical protein